LERWREERKETEEKKVDFLCLVPRGRGFGEEKKKTSTCPQNVWALEEIFWFIKCVGNYDYILNFFQERNLNYKMGKI
jgi:hypothetical protein